MVHLHDFPWKKKIRRKQNQILAEDGLCRHQNFSVRGTRTYFNMLKTMDDNIFGFLFLFFVF